MSQNSIENIKTILHVANGKPLLTSEIHNKLCLEYKYEGSIETVRRNLKFMEKIGIVSSVLHSEEKKNAWIIRENGKSQSGLKSDERSDIKEARIRHSDYIKNYIISHWLEQLPTKNDLILLWSEDIFPVEKDEMFPDFRNHIKTEYGNPFDELEKFKQVLHQFLSKKQELLDTIFDIYLKTKNEYFDEVFGWYQNANVIGDFIIERAISKRDMDFRSIFVDDFMSRVEEKNKEYFYYLMNYPKEMVATIGVGLKLRKKQFKEKMDTVVKKSLEKSEKSERIQKEITVLCELQEKLVYHIENMRKSLKKHLALGMLPND